jgi:hypothetical protein
MEQSLFKELLAQNIQSCSYAFDAITEENSSSRLNETTASVGFIFRHVGETMLLFGYFFGIPTDAMNTTMGKQDTGQGKDLSTSRELLQKGYALLEQIITSTPAEGWFEPVETPFLAPYPRLGYFPISSTTTPTMQVKSLLQLSAQRNRKQPATLKQLQFFYLHSIP